MKLILVNKHHFRVRQITLSSGWMRALLSVCVLGLPMGLGFYLGQQGVINGDDSDSLLTSEALDEWESALEEQKQAIALTQRDAHTDINAITLKMAELQARLVRLDALGERLISIADLDKGEFDFSQPPAIGGPETAALGKAYEPPEFVTVVNQLFDAISDREQQLDTLQALMAKRQLHDDILVAGRPVKKGWMSSRYGHRTDPFNGAIAWHGGVDFAGKLGSEIITVAAGVVIESSERGGYGGTVVINHGNGFKTLYAHNKQNLVNVGDVVKKGQLIALMGSTGRSTGPHVHFEVYKHGRRVDPATYIHRTHR